MGLFEDARDYEYFTASLKLADVCESLEMDKSSLTAKQLEELSWTEDLMKRVDWRSHDWIGVENREIAVLATHTRPFFYEILGQSLDYNKINLLRVLNRDDKNKRDVKIAKDFLKLLSNRCLAECQRESYSCC